MEALTSGWGIANCPWMVYACPPAKNTGGIAGFGRYGMVGPFGGDCHEQSLALAFQQEQEQKTTTIQHSKRTINRRNWTKRREGHNEILIRFFLVVCL